MCVYCTQALQKAPGGGGVAAAIDNIWPLDAASSSAQVHAARATWLQRWGAMVDTVWAPRGRPSSGGTPHRKRSAEEEHSGQGRGAGGSIQSKSRERKHAPVPGSSSSKAQGKGPGRDKASKGRQGSRKGGNSFDALMGYDGDG